MKVIDLEAIQASLDPDKAIAAVRSAFVAYSAGKVQLGAVGHLTFPEAGGDCHIKSAAMTSEEIFVVKIATGFASNRALGLKASNGMMVVFETNTGAPCALLQDEGYLTDLRTAIAGGLAAELLRPNECTAIGIIGTGIQAKLQAKLAARMTGLEHVIIWGRNHSRAIELAASLCAEGLRAEAKSDIVTLTRRTRLVITTTSTERALLTRANTRSGMRIIAVGADAPGKHEVESELVAAMNHLVADFLSQCFAYGELSWPARAGMTETTQVSELGTLLRNPSALAPDSSALVDLTGIGAQDLAIAAATLRDIDRKYEQ